jgi:hypothetical protein
MAKSEMANNRRRIPVRYSPLPIRPEGRGRSAERRIQPMSAPAPRSRHLRRSTAGAAARHADKSTPCASLIPFRARPPCGASPRHSPAQSQPHLAQPQTRVSWTRPGREFCPPLSLPSAASSSRTGPSAGRAVPRGRPGADRIHPRAGAAPAPSFRLAFRKGALG